MLRELPAKQFLEWQMFDQLNPIGDLRRDWQAASICAVIANIAAAQGRSKKRFKVQDFLLEFGEERERPERRQTWQEQKMIIQMVHAAFNSPKKKRNG